jgi:hypothetical protein
MLEHRSREDFLYNDLVFTAILIMFELNDQKYSFVTRLTILPNRHVISSCKLKSHLNVPIKRKMLISQFNLSNPMSHKKKC